jgi:hypothetical protein
MKYAEVFHDDKVRGNFLIADGTKYMFYVVESQEKGEQERQSQNQNPAISQIFYTEDKPFVDSQQFLFDNLCKNAIHVREKSGNRLEVIS